MKNRQFFINNSIQNFVALTKNSPFEPRFSENERIINTSTKRIKRVTSCYNSTSKLDATKFINRQAFNSKLYSTKTFNIAVEFKKQNQAQANKYFSFKDSQSTVNLKNKLQSKQNKHQFTSAIDNVSHRLKNIYHNLANQQNDNGVKLVKQELVLLKDGVERVLKSLLKQIQSNEQKYLKVLFSQKSQQNNISNNDLSESRNLLTAKQSPSYSSKTVYNQHFRSMSEKADFGTKPSTTSSSKLRQSHLKLQHQITQLSNNTNKLKTINDKLNLTQFENKKHILRIQSLQAQNSTLKQKIKSLLIDIDKMNQKVSKVKQIEQSFNYKIKKLKQQLQVAHIVKEQNLAEKMRYIMQNQK